MKLPRFTATTAPTGTGLVRADPRAQTDVGDAQFRGLQAFGGAIQDVGSLAGREAQRRKAEADRAAKERQALDDQAAKGEADRRAIDALDEGLGTYKNFDPQVGNTLPTNPKDYYDGDKLLNFNNPKKAEFRDLTYKDFEKKIKNLSKAIKDPKTRQAWESSQLVGGFQDFTDAGNLKHQEYQEALILGYAKDAAENGDIETSNEWIDIAEKHGLIGPKRAAAEREKNETAAAKAARDAVFQAALSLPLDEGIEFINNSGLLLDDIKTVRTEYTTQKNIEAKQVTIAFDARVGDESARLGGLLADNLLTVPQINEVDLKAVGDQKTEEEAFKEKWRGLLRATVTRKEPLVSNEDTYDNLTVMSELVKSGSKTPGEFETAFAEANAAGELTPNDRRTLRSKDIVATQSMQNSTFTQTTTDNRASLVAATESELQAMVTARDLAIKLKDVPKVNALDKALKKSQVQKWNFGRYRTDLRKQISQNPEWSQKQIFVASDILIEKYDKPFDALVNEFDNDNADSAITATPPDDAFKDIWKGLSQSDKAKVWALRMAGASVEEITGEIPSNNLRPDGSKKDVGFLGVPDLPNGRVATEFSVGTTDVTGKEIDIPTLVPTLTIKERDIMVNDIIPNNKDVPDEIVKKAVAHAKKRISQGKSVFFEQGEQ